METIPLAEQFPLGMWYEHWIALQVNVMRKGFLSQ